MTTIIFNKFNGLITINEIVNIKHSAEINVLKIPIKKWSPWFITRHRTNSLFIKCLNNNIICISDLTF